MITETSILAEINSKILGGKFRDNTNFRDLIIEGASARVSGRGGPTDGRAGDGASGGSAHCVIGTAGRRLRSCEIT
jgi:hypothetical protein